jgi:hypothetical protein
MIRQNDNILYRIEPFTPSATSYGNDMRKVHNSNHKATLAGFLQDK